ncbi:MAG TPA: prolyl-tRNA editing protein, partial [Gammaproteobacteria bacterium]|nr:prolyl-tRNA editing protein [Gammaproteobacteria bacterium]
MKPVQHSTAARVQELLGSQYTVLEFDQPTRSAAEAAEAIGCTIAQIAKSLVFAGPDNEPVLIVASGINQVDEKKVGALLGGAIGQADAAFVKKNTG